MRGGRMLFLRTGVSRNGLCYAGASSSWSGRREGRSSASRRHHAVVAAALMTTAAAAQQEASSEEDPYAWLEAIEGEEALAWVRKENERTFAKWGLPSESERYVKVLEALESKEKIPGVRKMGRYFYNFWTDGANPRGLVRRVLVDDYALKEPPWETVLDVDALGKAENVSWVYGGQTPYRLGGVTEVTRTIISLSPGGSDASVRREFDLKEKKFVEVHPFRVDTASKNRVSWADENTLLVGIPSEGLATTSGYPRCIQEWTRGGGSGQSDFSESPVVFEGNEKDVAVTGTVSRSRGVEFEWRTRSTSFYTSKKQVRRHDPTSLSKRTGVWYDLNELGLPESATVSHFGSTLLIELRDDWPETSKIAGSLLAVDFDEFTTKGPTTAKMAVVFEPDERTSLEGVAKSKDFIALVIQEDVKTKLEFKVLKENGQVVADVVPPTEPSIRSASLSAVDPDESNDFFLRTSSFLEPSTLNMMTFDEDQQKFETRPLKQLPSMFDGSKHTVSQKFATSKDGTEIPYFVVRHNDEDPKAPCLCFAYGGFEISLGPSYNPSVGRGWLERGGTYVVANIRGGGEYGPKWHQAALKENRQKAYDDLHAVAEDLVASGVVESSKRFAIRGGSNGGLLVANAYVQRPDLYGAIVCAVPLINMKRYTHLLAGASWSGEYGDPDSDDWDNFLKNYSPYHNVADTKEERAKYPPLLVTTSTKDDRVHPSHARSFVKKLRDLGVDNVWYYENIEGGHGGAADAKQAAFQSALYLDFLYDTLANPPPPE
mmetsp:Transcript_3986/g.13040  ORF Transcript_3986/g.13040 Transcript_3986/m.13040 type:complete len:772 (+) Transcript_3986:708-3023(+)